MELSRWLYQVGHGQRLHRADCGILRASARRGSPESTVRLCRLCVDNLDGGEDLFVEAWCAHTSRQCSDLIGSKATLFRQCLQCRSLEVSCRQVDRARLGLAPEDPLPAEAAGVVPAGDACLVAVEDVEPRGPPCPALAAEPAPITPEESLGGWEVVSGVSSAGPSEAAVSEPRAIPKARAVQRAQSAGAVDLQGSPSPNP